MKRKQERENIKVKAKADKRAHIINTKKEFKRRTRTRKGLSIYIYICMCVFIFQRLYLKKKGKKIMKNLGSSGRLSSDENDDEELSKVAIASFQAREEEIEKKKMEVKEKVESQLTRAEEETRRLAHVWEVSSR